MRLECVGAFVVVCGISLTALEAGEGQWAGILFYVSGWKGGSGEAGGYRLCANVSFGC